MVAFLPVAVASRPLQMQLTPDGSLLMVTSYDSAITFIDPATDRPVTIDCRRRKQPVPMDCLAT